MKLTLLKNRVTVIAVVALMIAGLAGFMVPSALATNNPFNDSGPTPQVELESLGDVERIISRIFNILFWVLILLAAIFIIWAAFLYLTAGGDPEKVKKANHIIIYAVVAIVIALVAKSIPTLVCSLVGEECAPSDIR